MPFKKDLLDELIKNCKTTDDIFGTEGIVKQLQKALVERMLEAEMKHHLGYEKHEQLKSSGNYRNGSSSKKITTGAGSIDVEIPRDRLGSFDPQLIGKYQRRLPGFDEKVLSMYSRGMTTRDIQAHIYEIYQTEISPDLVSTITDEVIQEVEMWQKRPLDKIYPIVFMDAIVLKIKDNGHVQNKALNLAIGVNLDGDKEILGMWLTVNEGAKFWLSVITELKNRGIEDIYIACVDGLKGFPEAINSVFPHTQVQLCIVHMLRNSFKFVPFKNRKEVAADLKPVYTANNETEAKIALSIFRNKWDGKYPTVGELWDRNWAGIVPFLGFTKEIRKVIYTTNVIESINYGIRRITKNRNVFPDDKAALKLVYLTLKNLEKRWTRPLFNWKDALNQFAIIFGDRFPKSY